MDSINTLKHLKKSTDERIEMLEDLHYFSLHLLTDEQKKETIEKKNDNEIIVFLADAYNSYIELMSDKVKMKMITNPNDLFLSSKEKQDFVKFITDHIKSEMNLNVNGNILEDDRLQ